MLVFQPLSLLKPHLRHALAADKHAATEAQNEDEEVLVPGLHLTKGVGVYLQSNGRPLAGLQPVYAKGCHPKRDKQWWDTAQEHAGPINFTEFFGINEQMLEAPDSAALWLELGEEDMTVTIVV